MTALQSIISLSIILFLVLALFNQYRVDALRQELFEIRDRLFDEAAKGNIAFGSHAYRATRTVLNGLLRFGHRISLLRFFLTVFFVPKRHLAHSAQMLDQAMSASPVADRELCARYIREAHKAVTKHLIKSPFSFVLLLWAVSVVLSAVGISLASYLVETLSSKFRELDRAAFAEGCQ